MTTTLPAAEVTLRTLKQRLNLRETADPQFFPEWQIETRKLAEMEQRYLDRVKGNFLDLLEDPPALKNSVKMVVLAPLLALAGFYRRPFRITTETSITVALEDERQVIQGAIGVLVPNQPITQYATSRLFSLLNPHNELYHALSILKHLAKLKQP